MSIVLSGLHIEGYEKNGNKSAVKTDSDCVISIKAVSPKTIGVWADFDGKGIAPHSYSIKDHSDAHHKAKIGPGLLKNMAERQEGHRCVRIRQVGEAGTVEIQRGVEARVHQHGAFRLAGGAGGVDKCGDVVGGSLGRAQFDLGTRFGTGLGTKAQEVDIRQRAAVIGIEHYVRVHGNNMFKSRALSHDGTHGGILALVAHHNNACTREKTRKKKNTTSKFILKRIN